MDKYILVLKENYVRDVQYLDLPKNCNEELIDKIIENEELDINGINYGWRDFNRASIFLDVVEAENEELAKESIDEFSKYIIDAIKI